MQKRLIPCVLVCLMIFLAGCNSNTAKEAAQEKTKTETSFPAGNAENLAQEEMTEAPETSGAEVETQITAEKKTALTETQTSTNKPVEEKPADSPPPTITKAETSKQTPTQPAPEQQTEQQKEQETAAPNPTEKPVETMAEPKPTEKPVETMAEPKPTEPPKQNFDVSPYVSYAQEYAVSIGLTLDSTAIDCWDNPISANPNRTGIKSDIQSRLDRYKNSDGFTAVWIWAEKVSDTEYEIYIGYC